MKKKNDNFLVNFIIKELKIKTKINQQTNLEDIDEWDSLSALVFMELAELKFQKKINGNHLQKCKKVSDLIKLLK
jgi:acyl carrier protein